MGNHSSTPSRFSFSIRPTRRRTVAYPFPILNDDTPSTTLSKQSSSDAVSLGYYLKPSGLYPTCTWDNRHVARLITRGQLVPRYPGKDEPCTQAREECPICMLVYPMLNTTKCCSARLCTECYLQIRPPRHNRQPCPFCKKKKVHAGFKNTRSMSEMDREEKDHLRAVQAMKKEVLQQESQMISCKQTQQHDDDIEQPITLEGCRINILGAKDVERDEYEANDEILSSRKISSNWLRKEDQQDDHDDEDEEEKEEENTGMFAKTEQVEIIESDSMYGSLASSSSSSCQQMSGILAINVEPEEDLERKKKEEVKTASFRGRRSLTGRKHAIHITTTTTTTTSVMTGKVSNGNRNIGECDRPDVGRSCLASIMLNEENSLQEAIRRSLYEK